eukprot:411267_1
MQEPNKTHKTETQVIASKYRDKSLSSVGGSSDTNITNIEHISSLEVQEAGSVTIQNQLRMVNEVSDKESMLNATPTTATNTTNHSDTDDDEPAPADDDQYPETSFQTLKLAIGQDTLSTRDQEREPSTDTMATNNLTIKNTDSVMAQPGDSPQMTPQISLNASAGDLMDIEYAPDAVVLLSPLSHVKDERMSIDDQYIKPTLEALQSYNATEEELDNIMNNVIVSQSQHVLQAQNSGNTHNTANAEERDLELHTDVSLRQLKAEHPSIDTADPSLDFTVDTAITSPPSATTTTIPTMATPPPITPPVHSPVTTVTNTQQTHALAPILEDDSKLKIYLEEDAHQNQAEEDELHLYKITKHLQRIANAATPINNGREMDSPSLISMTASTGAEGVGYSKRRTIAWGNKIQLGLG